MTTKLLFRRIKKINGDIAMKIELTNKEICILYYCVKELVTRSKETKYCKKYPNSTIKVYEDLAKKIEDSLK